MKGSMQHTNQFWQSIIDYLAQLPVELFVFAGSFIEELVSPIPSFLVFMPAGALVEAHGTAPGYIVVLAIIAAIARVPAAALLYWLAATLRGRVFKGRKQWLGIRQKDIESFRKQLGARRSWWMLFLMWAIPIFPGAPISLASGFVRFPLLAFVTATFFGSIINAGLYLVIGYLGLKALKILQVMELAGQFIAIAVLVAVLVWLAWRYNKKRKKA